LLQVIFGALRCLANSSCSRSRSAGSFPSFYCIQAVQFNRRSRIEPFKDLAAQPSDRELTADLSRTRERRIASHQIINRLPGTTVHKGKQRVESENLRFVELGLVTHFRTNLFPLDTLDPRCSAERATRASLPALRKAASPDPRRVRGKVRGGARKIFPICTRMSIDARDSAAHFGNASGSIRQLASVCT